MTRRQEFAAEVPRIVQNELGGEPVSLALIYGCVAGDLPGLIDNELEPDGALRWKHELRWELESLVRSGVVHRRKDLGKGMYSTDPSASGS